MKFDKELKVFGDTSFRGKCPTETAEQITFFGQLRKKFPQLGSVALHIRNEGKKNINQVRQEKAEGMVSGASDIIIPGKSCFVCELKRKDHTQSKWQPNQREYRQAASDNGSYVCVALGWEAAMEAVKDWINATK